MSKCFAKISRRKFSDDLKRVTEKNPYRKTSAWDSLFNEIAGRNSRLASLVKKPPPKTFTCEYIRTFSASPERSYTSSFFFIKLRAVYYMVATLLRSWSTIDFFVKILFFKTASFRYIFQKVSVMNYLNS